MKMKKDSEVMTTQIRQMCTLYRLFAIRRKYRGEEQWELAPQVPRHFQLHQLSPLYAEHSSETVSFELTY